MSKSKWPKHKKSIISAPGLARAILSVFSNHGVVYMMEAACVTYMTGGIFN